MKRVGRWLAGLFRWTLRAIAAVLILLCAAIAVAETSWGKNRLRELIVYQGNQYLTATLEIGRLQGSLLRGLQLSDVRLSRGGETIIQIDDVSLEYSIRELIESGTSIRRIRLARPRVVMSREADGRWNVNALIKRDTQRQERRGPGRPLHLLSIEVSDGHVVVREPLKLGATRPPTEYEDLDLQLSFDYVPVDWQLVFTQASWKGHAPELTVGSFTGTIANGSAGWRFENLVVDTPGGHLVVDGAVDRSQTPSRLRFDAKADRFAFQEWAPILPTVSRIGVTASFEATLDGPAAALNTTIDLSSDGGDAGGTVVLNTTVPGWRFTGALDVNRLNLATWLSRPEDRSDISGNIEFDLGLPPDVRFPTGTYRFDGSHAAFMGYEADDLKARGHITATDAIIEDGIATAYGANVTLESGRIGIASPFTFDFSGLADGVDLRMLPPNVPVPHVESTLFLRYDVSGQFSNGFLVGTAAFGPSEFLGASIGEGAYGAIDTRARPFVYSGEGALSDVDLHRFGAGLNVTWLQEPRYDGTLAGYFRVEGSGSEAATMTLNGSGQLSEASLFGGTLSNADVSIGIADGTLTGSYDGEIADVDPAIAFGDARYAARLTGAGAGRVTVPDLLTRSPTLEDYTVEATLRVQSGTSVRGVALTSGEVGAVLADGTLTINRLTAAGPALDGSVRGRLELDGERSSALDYTVVRADLAQLRDLHGRELSGALATQGQLTGPWDRLRLVGDGTLARLEASGLDALSTTAHYDVSIPTGAPDQAVGRIDGRMSLAEAFGQQLKEVSGSVVYESGTATVDLQLVRQDDLTGAITGRAVIHRQEQSVDLQALTLTIAHSAWTLANTGRPRLAWNDRGIVVTALELVDVASARQRVSFDGTWYAAGDGALRVAGRDISLDALFGSGGAASRYGGTLGLDATLRGTRERPLVDGQFAITDGRVWRTPFQKFAGRIDYRGGAFDVDARLDQAPGVWMTIVGAVPLALFDSTQPDLPVDVAIASSRVGLGLIEGMTDRVRNVAGTAEVNVRVVGTARDPHFNGRVDIQDAVFVATQSGGRYKNGRVALRLATDRVTVEQFHLEDNAGDPLDLSGSLATHELRVGDLVIDLRARQFEVLRNQYGTMDIDAVVNLRGQFESPRLSGRITVSGGQLAVDAILDRTIFQPYATTAAPALVETDAIAALNPWDRLGLDIELNVPNSLRLTGDNVQVTPGTPIGLGDINLRALGDLYLYKDPAQPLYITGSLDSVTGTYQFQGRSFDLDPTSSITFRGDSNPELYVTVRRDISGVDTRVTIAGPLDAPELRLASTPPLDPSDILSLIVFNTSTNQLSALQQEQLAVRAGTLAAGFLTAPLVTALERSLGLDTLEIEPVATLGGAGTRVTIGNEIAPGLVARFSRQFGETEYDEATIEYYLSRILRIRGTFSDATGLATRSLFRRVERAGIDLLLFFSF